MTCPFVLQARLERLSKIEEREKRGKSARRRSGRSTNDPKISGQMSEVASEWDPIDSPQKKPASNWLERLEATLAQKAKESRPRAADATRGVQFRENKDDGLPERSLIEMREMEQSGNGETDGREATDNEDLGQPGASGVESDPEGPSIKQGGGSIKVSPFIAISSTHVDPMLSVNRGGQEAALKASTQPVVGILKSRSSFEAPAALEINSPNGRQPKFTAEASPASAAAQFDSPFRAAPKISFGVPSALVASTDKRPPDAAISVAAAGRGPLVPPPGSTVVPAIELPYLGFGSGDGASLARQGRMSPPRSLMAEQAAVFEGLAAKQDAPLTVRVVSVVRLGELADLPVAPLRSRGTQVSHFDVIIICFWKLKSHFLMTV